MRAHEKQLGKELRQAGASDAEIRELLPIAANLHLLKEPELPVFKPTPWWQAFVKPAMFVIPSLAFGMAIIILSQAALPTSLLYPVQKLSDNVISGIQPSYKAEVMMKRAQQVNQLVNQKAESGVILATLASYSTNAKSYKTQSHASYAAFEYCKSNLQQATAKASPAVRDAINASLKSLES